MAQRSGARALVAHGPALSAWCALFARLVGLKIPIVAHSFNFTKLPPGIKRLVFSLALPRIDRFVVFSAIERTLYAKTFNLPINRFDVLLWGVQPPVVDRPEMPLQPGDYVSAIGGNARDYRTMVDAARQLPEIMFVLVVRPESLHGLELPANVVVHTDLPFGRAMNVLLHSRFMVLPLIDSTVPCGHVTLVAAMHLGKAFIVTDSLGVRDYIRNGDNALTVTSGSVDSLVCAIARLWQDRDLCRRLGESGRNFAARECTEDRIVDHFRDWLSLNAITKSA
jgi:glycosyltransferase involved in cell wall biosynthesis